MVVTWNAANLARSPNKELALHHLLVTSRADIGVITETEFSPAAATVFSLSGFKTLLPPAAAGLEKVRLVVLVRDDLLVDVKPLFVDSSANSPAIWLQLAPSSPSGCPPLVVGGVYRPWVGLAAERVQLDCLLSQAATISSTHKRIILLGDFNLDPTRLNNSDYGRAALARTLTDSLANAGYFLHPTSPTWYSHGQYNGKRRTSTIDLVFTAGLDASVSVLPDATTDHRPVKCVVAASLVKGNLGPRQIMTRNIKRVTTDAWESALDSYPWHQTYEMDDVNKVAAFIKEGIAAALDVVAPLRAVRIKPGAPLYLSRETKLAMAARDAAARGTDSYKRLRNRATALTRRDRLLSNLERLSAANYDCKTLWALANEALGKGDARHTPKPPLERGDGVKSSTPGEAATVLNDHYVNKIIKIRESIAQLDLPPPTPLPQPLDPPRFEFVFANAARTAKIIKGLKPTNAAGDDGVPVSLLKRGAQLLAGPISHLVNRSLADGVVPDMYKVGKIIPVHKGKGKSSSDAASYRPVAILPAASKVLESFVKTALLSHLTEHGLLPDSQHGFRPGRSTTTAVAAAHGAWHKIRQSGRALAVAAFDFSSAFDTVDATQLLSKLDALGVRGTPAAWFRSYLTGGRQFVVWDGAKSAAVAVNYGVRQGSILGPLLFVSLMYDLPLALGITDGDDSSGIISYADDVTVWAAGDDVGGAVAALELLAAKLARYAAANALALNKTKTQILAVGAAPGSLSVDLDGEPVLNSDSIDLLGVKITSDLSLSAHTKSVTSRASVGAAMAHRLAAHLPRGPYLRRLVQGVVQGQIGYAAAVTAPVRLADDHPVSSAAAATQRAINRAARAALGARRADHIPVSRLLEETRLPSYNRMAVRAVALEAWKAFVSDDGGGGHRNTLGRLLFEGKNRPVRSSSRAAADGRIPPPLRWDAATMVSTACTIWNSSKELRAAVTLAAAKRAASKLANAAPI